MLAGKTAVELVRMVHVGEVSPVEVVGAHLERISAFDAQIGAFETVRNQRALAEAELLPRRADLAQLPLAGVPIAVKDNLPVAGEAPRTQSLGSLRPQRSRP